MKKYDFKKAEKIIEDNKDKLTEAALGMHEDWFCTAEAVFENGKYNRKLEDGMFICGIYGSYWATPTLQLCFKDGTEKMVPCHDDGESKERKIDFGLGVLSGLVQENITPLTEL